jgi:hypothetical protein
VDDWVVNKRVAWRAGGGWMYGWMDGLLGGWVGGWMDEAWEWVNDVVRGNEGSEE